MTHTRLKNRDVQAMLEALIDVWTEELVSGGRIELEELFVIETQTVDRGEQMDGCGLGTRRVTFGVSWCASVVA